MARRRGISAALAAVALAVAATGCGTSSNDDAKGSSGCSGAKIGVAAPLTGVAAPFGQSAQAVAQYEVKKLNAAGGIKLGGSTCKFTVKSYDTQGLPDVAARATAQMTSDGVKIVIGYISSDLDGARQLLVRNNELVVHGSLEPANVGTDVPLFFLQTAGPTVYAPSVIKWALQNYPGIKTVVDIAPDSSTGDAGRATIGPAWKAAGVNLVDVKYASGTTDFAPTITGLLRNHPDLVDLTTTAQTDAAAIAKQLRLAGYSGPIGKTGGDTTDAVVAAVGGEAMLGDYFGYSSVQADTVAKFASDFKAVMGTAPPSASIAVGFEPVLLSIFSAIKSTGSVDTEKVAQAMRSQTHLRDPYVGPIQWLGTGVQGGEKSTLGYQTYVRVLHDGQWTAVKVWGPADTN